LKKAGAESPAFFLPEEIGIALAQFLLAIRSSWGFRASPRSDAMTPNFFAILDNYLQCLSIVTVSTKK